MRNALSNTNSGLDDLQFDVFFAKDLEGQGCIASGSVSFACGSFLVNEVEISMNEASVRIRKHPCTPHTMAVYDVPIARVM